jgi:hypothetical protein
VLFYDRRNYPDTRTDVYLARSTDGGATFIDFRISDSPFAPTTSTFFGDYINITAHMGVVRPIWTRLSGGALSIWTAIIDYPVAVQNNKNTIPSRFELMQNYPNPFNPETKIRFSVPANRKQEMTDVKIIIYDILGRQITALVNESLKPGSYEIGWNAANHSSGIYYYKLVTKDFTDTKKMVLVK